MTVKYFVHKTNNKIQSLWIINIEKETTYYEYPCEDKRPYEERLSLIEVVKELKEISWEEMAKIACKYNCLVKPINDFIGKPNYLLSCIS
jgi:hypothetical protein